ncbi:DUF1292 domain-containing protein [Pseudalkalibacillus hwajinpoensis]|uniref:UPF0473 protein FBF83_13410 n=1 Tax=Guptibacillus hwajinpoensis TaxID=208199 RepID=A0A4U1MID8_9BACL|nr:DUF1292 domain-containing protein [Pseudalkalibacillus hwajinpoensis]TKD70236.1 DUF1292 domain-containing protein [Pseudalkalibacillus hwajinpoensis]
MEEKERIIIPDENGDEHLFEVLFTFDVEENGHSYMTVVPADQADSEDEVEVYAFRYEEEDNEERDYKLFPIESDKEWEIVEEMLNTFSEEEEEADE